jgi:DNA (cytosine-5)-methyltransferase 1
LDPSKLPDFDILTAGFPCQSFSVAGNEKGFKDDRGNLFFEIIKIAKEKRPSILFLENVKGLLSNDSGRTFLRILIELDAIGYDVQWQVINGKYFVPQQRERVFIIGTLREKPRPEIFPISKSDQMDNGQNEREQNKQVVNCITSTYYKGLDKHGERTMVFTAHTKGNIQNRIQNRNETWTLDTSGTKQLLFEKNTLRKLTPLEYERLMGFPDNWTRGQTDTQRYKMLGNAVIPQIIEMIGKRIDINR